MLTSRTPAEQLATVRAAVDKYLRVRGVTYGSAVALAARDLGAAPSHVAETYERSL